MKHPQSLAIDLYNYFPSEQLRPIKSAGCCAFVLLWCLGIEPDDAEAIIEVEKMIQAKVVKPNCVVKWFESVTFLTGRTLEKVDFVKINTIRNIKERTPVFFQKDPNSDSGHWVGVEDGEIRFNPLSYSVNVAEGRPTEARILTFKGGVK